MRTMRVAAGLLMLASLLFVGGTANAEAKVDGNRCSGDSSGWFCFYEHQKFEGRAQSFESCGQFNLDYWDEASSWRHQQYGVAGVTVFNYGPSTPSQLWTMTGTNNSSTLVTGSHNDKADYFINYC
jgi:hypothetical protein